MDLCIPPCGGMAFPPASVHFTPRHKKGCPYRCYKFQYYLAFSNLQLNSMMKLILTFQVFQALPPFLLGDDVQLHPWSPSLKRSANSISSPATTPSNMPLAGRSVQETREGRQKWVYNPLPSTNLGKTKGLR